MKAEKIWGKCGKSKGIYAQYIYIILDGLSSIEKSIMPLEN